MIILCVWFFILLIIVVGIAFFDVDDLFNPIVSREKRTPENRLMKKHTSCETITRASGERENVYFLDVSGEQ